MNDFYGDGMISAVDPSREIPPEPVKPCTTSCEMPTSSNKGKNGTSLIYIARHLLHEVTSPQAFEGLDEKKRQKQFKEQIEVYPYAKAAGEGNGQTFYQTPS